MEASTKPINELVLDKKPWIDSSSIASYDVSSHCIFLTNSEAIYWPKIMLKGSPFVVVLDGKSVCLGAIWSLISSFAPTSNIPIISEPLGSPKHTDIICIEHGETLKDIPGFVQTLQRDGQYRGGLGVILNSVKQIGSKTNSTLIYKYTVKNLDNAPLYIIDPIKMGSDDFLRYQNGIFCLIKKQKQTGNRQVEIIRRFDPIPNIKPTKFKWGECDPSWFVRIEPGKELSREFSDPNFPTILPGEYECLFSFRYPGFFNGMNGLTPKGEYGYAKGRYWIGQIQSTGLLKIEGKGS